MSKKPFTVEDIPSQEGKIALVTGATSGLGYETALALSRAGATVIVCGRNEVKGKEVLDRIRTSYPEAKVEFGKVDQCSLASVAELAANISKKYRSLDILINNAGVFNQNKREVTEDGFEIMFQTNHLSHFALTAHLLPLLRKSSSPHVVTVSSEAYSRGKINFEDLQSENNSSHISILAQSQLSRFLFSFELQRKSDAYGWGIISNVVHPGACKTEGIENLSGVFGWIIKYIVMPLVAQSAAAGALYALFAATSPDAEGGAYYTPNGYLKMNGPVTKAYIAENAKDLVLASKLWDVSVSLAGVSWPDK